MLHRFEVLADDCIGCGLCEERAPANMELPDGASTAQVVKQPENSAEEEACLEASDYCPLGGLVRTNAPDSARTNTSSNDTQPSLTPAGDSLPLEVPQ